MTPRVAGDGFNVAGPVAGCDVRHRPSDHLGVADLHLGPLGANGGPTKTVALRPGSVALDLVPSGSCSVVVDQRGVHRPQGPRCDTGAYERRA